MTTCAFMRSSWSTTAPSAASKLVVRVRFPSPALSEVAASGEYVAAVLLRC
jgi:hypothetical protein